MPVFGYARFVVPIWSVASGHRVLSKCACRMFGVIIRIPDCAYSPPPPLPAKLVLISFVIKLMNDHFYVDDPLVIVDYGSVGV